MGFGRVPRANQGRTGIDAPAMQRNLQRCRPLMDHTTYPLRPSLMRWLAAAVVALVSVSACSTDSSPPPDSAAPADPAGTASAASDAADEATTPTTAVVSAGSAQAADQGSAVDSGVADSEDASGGTAAESDEAQDRKESEAEASASEDTAEVSGDVGTQSSAEDTLSAEAQIAAEKEQQRAAEERRRREEEEAEAAEAARKDRERNIARCREIITEAIRVIEDRRSVKRFNVQDDILNAVSNDYEAVAASTTRTILGLYDQIAAHDSVIASDACAQAMDDETMQSWISSRHDTATKLDDTKKSCRRYFLEPALLQLASVPMACD